MKWNVLLRRQVTKWLCIYTKIIINIKKGKMVFSSAVQWHCEAHYAELTVRGFPINCYRNKKQLFHWLLVWKSKSKSKSNKISDEHEKSLQFLLYQYFVWLNRLFAFVSVEKQYIFRSHIHSLSHIHSFFSSFTYTHWIDHKYIQFKHSSCTAPETYV